jgi:methylisocitrate lyase
MVEKIRVALAARRDPDFVIIARNNACRTHDLDEAVRRAEAYRRAGADMLLVLPKTPEQARAIGERVEGPLFYMPLGGIESFGMSLAELGKLGYRLAVDSVTPFLAQHKTWRLYLQALSEGRPDPTMAGGHAEETELVHRSVGLQGLLDIERRSVEQ